MTIFDHLRVGVPSRCIRPAEAEEAEMARYRGSGLRGLGCRKLGLGTHRRHGMTRSDTRWLDIGVW